MSKFTDFAEMKDAIGFKNTFQDAVAEKVSAALENFKTNLAQSIFKNNDEVNEEAKGNLPAGVKVKKITGETAEGPSEHEVSHNGKSLGVISHDWEGSHNAVHAPNGKGGEEDYSHHSTHHAAVKAILKTHGIKEEVENVEEEKIEMTRGGRATGNAIKDIVAKNNARIAKKKADAEKAEKKKNS